MADVANCPRCGAKSITMNVTALNLVGKQNEWAKTYEAFGVCRACWMATTFVIDEITGHDTELFEKKSPLQVQDALNNYFEIRGYINLKDQATVAPPEHVPPHIANVFREAATCMAVECWKAAGTMFRLCVDLATRPMLPQDGAEGGPNAKVRRDLGLRLPWLFENGKLPD